MTRAFSPDRLERLTAAMQAYVDSGTIAGAVLLLDRDGEAWSQPIGRRDLETGRPMTRDTLFRVASMTKPVTAVAGMSLVEQGRLRLDDPVDRWLPELEGRRVLRQLDGALDDTVPAKRAITVRDLFTFRLGYGMLFGPEASFPMARGIAEAGVVAGPPAPDLDPDEWMRRLGRLPLMHQPGERWMYHYGSEVLGVLVSRVAAKPLGQFMQETIFEPLGMKETAFSVAPGDEARLAGCYVPSAAGLTRFPPSDYWLRPPKFESGGSGLVSSADDFLAFGRMMRDLGAAGNRRILARPTVLAMTTDQLSEPLKQVSQPMNGMWRNRGWGLGFSVFTHRDGIAASPGKFGWDGAFGSSWYVDPAEKLVSILMIQRYENPLTSGVVQDFHTLAYQALGD